MPIKEVRRRVKDLIRDIERQAAIERRAKKKAMLGAAAVMEADPQYRPTKLDGSPVPDFHARHPDVRKEMRDAHAWVVAAYALAAERLRAGDRLVRFPEGTHPPGLPLVPFARGRPP